MKLEYEFRTKNFNMYRKFLNLLYSIRENNHLYVKIKFDRISLIRHK